MMLTKSLLFEVKELNTSPYIPDEKQMDFIKNSLFSYFGINEDILQNNKHEDMECVL